MGDEVSGDDPMAMGIDSSGAPVQHWGSGDVGTVPGIHGVPAGGLLDHENPDGNPLPDVAMPAAPDQSASTSWIGDVLHGAYQGLTTLPDTTASQTDAITEEADRQRRIDQEMDREETGRHVLPAPEQHF